jgi:hypothetical protein
VFAPYKVSLLTIKTEKPHTVAEELILSAAAKAIRSVMLGDAVATNYMISLSNSAVKQRS